ncbi:hypothetical protein [Myxococcus xanthus]|uniref:hypothetical protein n=1 Tax=Myxococcus xanthus TaxID=34 RepID=UPI0020A35F60|nr:hypothetical protein [Myxococcus xanthus]
MMRNSKRLPARMSASAIRVGVVEAGLGLTLAPASSQALCPKGGGRPLSGAAGHAELVVAFPGTRPAPAAQHFRVLAHEAVSRSGRSASD